MNKLVTPSRRSGRSPFHLASASGVSPPRSLMMKTMAITISIAALEEESSRSVFSTVHVIFGTRVKNDPLGKGSHADGKTYHLERGENYFISCLMP